MKTKIVTISLLSLFLLSGSTQTSGQGFSLGAKAGAGFSYLSNFDNNEGMLKRSPNIMFDGGLIGNAAFSKLISLQFEVLFEQKGEVYKMTVDETTEKLNFRMNYLTLPILLQFSQSFGNIKLFGGLGPYVGYAISGKFGTSDASVKIKFGKGEFSRIDAGAAVNLGAGFKAGRGHILLDLRYNYGLMDIIQPEEKQDGYKTKCNRNFVVSVGYLIPLGKN